MTHLTLDTAEAKRVTALATRATELGHPQLSAVHIAYGDSGTAVLTARSLDLAIEQSLTATTTNGGARILVGAKRLAEVVAKAPGDTVTLTPTEGGLAVTSGRWRATIPTIPPAEYDPYLLQPLDGDGSSVFDGDTLLATLAPVVLAASADKSRPLLAGVHLANEADGLRFVATDSYRLATRALPLMGEGTDVTVPADVLRLLADVHQAGDDIELATTTRVARFDTGNTVIQCQLIEGEYPAWRNLLNHNAKTPTGWLTVDDPDDLAAAVLRSGRLFGGDSSLVHLFMHADSIDVEASAADEGTGAETVPAHWTGPDGFQVTYNAKFLAEGLRSFGGPVVATVLDELKPTTMRAADGDDPAAVTSDDLYLLMPVARNR